MNITLLDVTLSVYASFSVIYNMENDGCAH